MEVMSQHAADGDYIYFVTTNVQDGRWFFVIPERAEPLGQAKITCCRMKGFDLLAFAILPNHVHLLVRKLRAGEIIIRHTATPQRTLENMRCREKFNASEWTFLFTHRRLSSRRSLQKPPCYTLSELMQSIKGTYSRSLPKGKFWHRRSFIRIIGSTEYLNNVLNYVRYNYRKMRLSEHYGQPPFVFYDHTPIDRLFY